MADASVRTVTESTHERFAMSSNTTFKAVPTQEELAALNRDLSFHSVVNPHAKTLSAAQIEQ